MLAWVWYEIGYSLCPFKEFRGGEDLLIDATVCKTQYFAGEVMPGEILQIGKDMPAENRIFKKVTEEGFPVAYLSHPSWTLLFYSTLRVL